MELYREHRPDNLDDVIGQPDAVRIVRMAFKKKKVAHSWLLMGDSGVGKTTTARIIADMLGCDKSDFFEYNAADFNGIDSIREIRSRMQFSGLSKKKTRVYLLDEMHQLSKPAQNAMLKILEEPPPHVYFFLCTSEPNKVIKAIHTRCTKLALRAISIKDLQGLVKKAAKRFKIKLRSEQVLNCIVNAAEGSARQALVFLEMLQGVKSEENQLSIIEKNEAKAPAIMIARALLDRRTKWTDMSKILKDTAGEDVEKMRHMILAYMTTILLSGRADTRAAAIIEEFSPHCYDGKRPEFVLRAFNIICPPK